MYTVEAYSMIGAVATALGVLTSTFAESFPFIISLWYLLLLTLLVCSLGIYFAIWGHAILSSPYLTPPAVIDIVEREIQDFRELLEKDTNALRSCGSKGQQSFLPVVFGRTVDGLLQQLIDLVLRDFLLVWLREYCYRADVTVAQLKEDVWGAVQKLHQRLSRVDIDRLIAVDMVTKVTTHFEKIRIAHSCSMELNELPVFALSPHLMSVQKELHYLRQISELLIINLMPRSYSLSPISHLLREVLVCKVFQPAIDLLTEPDYLNQKILTYLEAQKAVAEMHVKTHDYARTFEDFLKMINSCNDVDALKRIRYNIMSEIMQATTLQNVKRARGIDIEALEKGGANVSRQQWSAARKIKRYIAQLTHAKTMCEQALLALGWEGAFPLHHTDSTQTLPLNTVLDSVTGRRYISLFLETVCSQGLVGFWTAVEELRYSHRSNWHQLGAEIFYTYIRSPSAEIKVDKDTWKRMEAFLLGDKGPEVFYEVQQMVFNTIQDKYYSAFVLSEQYKVMAKALLSEEGSEELSEEKSPLSVERHLSSESVSSAESAGAGMHLADSTYARRKLDQLQERLSNKTQALRALRASLRPGCRALQLLEREVERLAGERRRLEAHLARADAWADNLGRWRANVASAEIIEESKPPQFVIVVHVAEEEEDAGGDEQGAGGEGDKCRPEGITTGWVLLRTLTEFQDLHRKLKPMCPQIKNLDLPTNSFKFLFGKTDKNTLDKAKLQIQNYLEFVLEDDKLNQSEALYTFLSPSSEYFKHSNTPLPKKPRFSFSTLFKSNEANLRSCQERDSSAREGADEEEISLSLDAETEGEVKNSSGKGALWSGQEDGKDAIAEPLYSLLGEVFDMRGVFKWLRRTLISFVQITYGRTINRQIRDTISWLFSEQMLHYYMSVGIKAWWPGGTLCKPTFNRTRHEREESRASAREQFIGNVPEVLTSLVGAQTAQRGAQKVFDTLQNAPQNKQLFYDLLELLLLEVFPELKRHL